MVYVPYQDSKLTMLLSSALGGNAKAAIIVTASRSRGQAPETIQTLRFGEECSAVQNTATGSVASAVASLLKELDERIAALQEKIRSQERWVQVTTTRRDFDAEKNEYVDEVVVTTEIVGAEDLCQELEILQGRRRELTNSKA